jgi:hypothetical protein
MKRKGPPILVYNDWLAEYVNLYNQQPIVIRNGEDKNEWVAKYTEMYNEKPVVVRKGRDARVIFGGTPQLKEKAAEIVQLMVKMEGDLRHLENAMVEYAQEAEIENPTVYPVIVKASGEMYDKSYVNARVFWPLPNGVKKEMRVYIEPYVKGMKIDSDAYKLKLKQVVSIELKKRRENGFFSKFNTSSENTLHVKPKKQTQ